MRKDTISELGIDDQNRLYVRPSTVSFPMIYREGVEVHWEPSSRHLHSPPPRSWTHLDWLKHIIETADQHSCSLLITPSTIWEKIPESLMQEIKLWFASRADTNS